MIARPGGAPGIWRQAKRWVARSAQSTSLLKPTVQLAAWCPNASRIVDFPQQTLRVVTHVRFKGLRPNPIRS